MAFTVLDSIGLCNNSVRYIFHGFRFIRRSERLNGTLAIESPSRATFGSQQALDERRKKEQTQPFFFCFLFFGRPSLAFPPSLFVLPSLYTELAQSIGAATICLLGR